MPLWLDFSILGIFSILVVPAILRGYARLVRWRLPQGSPVRNTSLSWVRRSEQFWFRITPFILIIVAVMAAYFGLRSD
jgi:hypothetical protein